MAGLLDQILDPIFGNTKAEDQRIAELQSKRLDEALNFKAPEIEDVSLDRYSYIGDLAPELLNKNAYADIDPALASFDPISSSAYDDIALDPSTREAQMRALASLENIGDAGGMTAIDEANMNRALNQSGSQARGQREAVMQNMQARGLGGSGMELLAQLQANQAAQNQANQNSLDIAGMAQQRALDAIMQGGQMAGQMRGQDFEMEARRAAAKDAINQFNATNLYGMNQNNANTINNMAMYNQGRNLGVDQTNVGAVNAARAGNLQARQAISNANTDLGNQETLQNKVQNPMQNFQNKAQVNNVRQGAYQGAITAEDNKAARKDQKRSDMIGATTKAGVAVLPYILD